MEKCETYDETSRFYLALGFKEFEVFPNLWDEWQYDILQYKNRLGFVGGIR